MEVPHINAHYGAEGYYVIAKQDAFGNYLSEIILSGFPIGGDGDTRPNWNSDSGEFAQLIDPDKPDVDGAELPLPKVLL